MKAKDYITVTSYIFAFVALLHVLRLFYVWDVTMGAWIVPLWVSWVAVVVAGYLAYHGMKLKK